MTTSLSSSQGRLCLDALYGDLALRYLLHDLRGNLAAVSGWVELAALDGNQVPDGLARGVDDLCTLLAGAGEFAQLPPRIGLDLRDLLAGLTGAVAPPTALMIQACPLRLRAALQGSSPQHISLVDQSDKFAVLEIGGLPDEGVQLAERPRLQRLRELREADPFDRRLCTALLGQAASVSGGKLRKQSSDSLLLSLRRLEPACE